MIPPFDEAGNLPPGIQWATWEEFVARFGTTPHRRGLLEGLETALRSLRVAGCRAVYIGGSFVTTKEEPADFDACWDVEGVNPGLLDPIIRTVGIERRAQELKYRGDLFPVQMGQEVSETFLRSFQIDKLTRRPKGIVALDPGRLPS